MNREVKIWHCLQHPAIVPLRGYAIETDGTPSLISPWYDNGDVMNYLKKHPFADRRKIVRQVAEGLVYLHAQSPPVIHGDLKGANVLINRTFDAALCDFGLAKLLQDCPSSFTTSNVGMGTLRWCAPGNRALSVQHAFVLTLLNQSCLWKAASRRRKPAMSKLLQH